MKAGKVLLNLLFCVILILTGMKLSDLFLNYVDKVFAEEESFLKIVERGGLKKAEKKKDIKSYLRGKRTLARNLFGIPEERKEQVQPKAKTTEKKVEVIKRLNVQLLGVVVGAKCEAMILDGGKVRVIRIGDEVMGYKVVKIERDLVILERNGEKAEISFKYGGSSSRSSARTPQRKTIIRKPPPPPPRPVESTGIRRTSDGKIIISRDLINEALMSPQKFLRGIFIGPHFKDGKPDGFVIRYLSRTHLLSKMGLRKGDVIKKINGIEIRTVTDYYNAIRSITEGESLTLTVERKGKEMNIECEIR
ncbi:MAG: PDZ domain-containing protein [Synergistetes bacterium]|nr:PDZ domain-containing protein [Synergistota bacterium]